MSNDSNTPQAKLLNEVMQQIIKVGEKNKTVKNRQNWLDQILKANLQKVVDWNLVDKDEYLTAMILSPVSNLQIKELLKGALTDKINDHETFFKGIDASYYYEGYTEFKTSDL